MKVLGGVIAGVGVVGSLLSLGMPTSISTSVPSSLGYGLTDTSEVLNIGLLQKQAFAFHAGLALVIAGVVLFAAGAILERLTGSPHSVEGVAGAVSTSEPVMTAPTGTRPLTPIEYETISDEQKAKNARADRAAYIAAAIVAIGIFIIWLASTV